MKKKLKPITEGKVGAIVHFCGHNAIFIADIITVGNVVVVKANGRIEEHLIRSDGPAELHATHHVSDFPIGGFWRPDIGVLVVPRNQVRRYV